TEKSSAPSSAATTSEIASHSAATPRNGDGAASGTATTATAATRVTTHAIRRALPMSPRMDAWSLPAAPLAFSGVGFSRVLTSLKDGSLGAAANASVTVSEFSSGSASTADGDDGPAGVSTWRGAG